MKSFVEAQMAEEGYASASEYLLALIREDAEASSQARNSESKLLEGLQGPVVKMAPVRIGIPSSVKGEGLAGETIRP